MGQKTVRCYVSRMRNGEEKLNINNFDKVIEKIFSLPNVKITDNNNRCLLYSEKDDNNYMSLEYIKNVNNRPIDDKYMFFRIGRQKDIEGALKRNVNTFEGKEIIDKDEQGEYNLEICTYIMVDKANGIISELFGQFAPTVKSFIYIINKNIENLEKYYEETKMSYVNIMTDKMINSYAENADKLGKIIYQFEKPNIEFMKNLKMKDAQMIALADLDVLQVEVTLKGRNKIPLTSSALKIKNTIETLASLPKTIKDKLKIVGKESASNTKTYTFNEENVTYYIDVPVTKKEDGEIKKLSIEEIGEEVYIKISDLYENYKANLQSYI